MEDLELKDLITKVGIWVLIVIVFGGLMILIFTNKFGSKDIHINKIIDSNEQLFILVLNKKTSNKKELKQLLKDSNIQTEVIYKDKERYFDDFLKKLDITEEDIIEPTVIYVEDKKVISILVDIKKKEDLKTFIEYNIASGKER